MSFVLPVRLSPKTNQRSVWGKKRPQGNTGTWVLDKMLGQFEKVGLKQG